MVKKILYVARGDEDKDIWDFLKEIHGLDCDEAYSLEEAKRAIEKTDYRGVLLASLQIPSNYAAEDEYCVGGLDLIEHIEEKDLRLLVMTSASDNVIMRRMKERHKVIIKPTTHRTLIDSVIDVFG